MKPITVLTTALAAVGSFTGTSNAKNTETTTVPQQEHDRPPQLSGAEGSTAPRGAQLAPRAEGSDKVTRGLAITAAAVAPLVGPALGYALGKTINKVVPRPLSALPAVLAGIGGTLGGEFTGASGVLLSVPEDEQHCNAGNIAKRIFEHEYTASVEGVLPALGVPLGYFAGDWIDRKLQDTPDAPTTRGLGKVVGASLGGAVFGAAGGVGLGNLAECRRADNEDSTSASPNGNEPATPSFTFPVSTHRPANTTEV